MNGGKGYSPFSSTLLVGVVRVVGVNGGEDVDGLVVAVVVAGTVRVVGVVEGFFFYLEYIFLMFRRSLI